MKNNVTKAALLAVSGLAMLPGLSNAIDQNSSADAAKKDKQISAPQPGVVRAVLFSAGVLAVTRSLPDSGKILFKANGKTENAVIVPTKYDDLIRYAQSQGIIFLSHDFYEVKLGDQIVGYATKTKNSSQSLQNILIKYPSKEVKKASLSYAAKNGFAGELSDGRDFGVRPAAVASTDDGGNGCGNDNSCAVFNGFCKSLAGGQ